MCVMCKTITDKKPANKENVCGLFGVTSKRRSVLRGAILHCLTTAYQALTQGVVDPVVRHGVRQEEQEEPDFQHKGVQQADTQPQRGNRQTDKDKAAFKTQSVRHADIKRPKNERYGQKTDKD